MFNSKEMKNIWKIKNENEGYIAEADLGCFKNDVLKLSYFYRTHVLPLPFMCEVDEPNVLILALNPSYEPINDETDTSSIIQTYDFNSYISNLFNIDFFLNNDNSKKLVGEHTFKWWKNSVLRNIIPKKNTKIGIFNLCGYHSRQYENIPKKFLIADSYLPTQQITKKIIKNLIESKTAKLVIIVWGKDEWKNFLDIDLDNRFIVINQHNKRNKSIYNHYKNPKTIDNEKYLIDKFFDIAD